MVILQKKVKTEQDWAEFEDFTRWAHYFMTQNMEFLENAEKISDAYFALAYAEILDDTIAALKLRGKIEILKKQRELIIRENLDYNSKAYEKWKESKIQEAQ